MLEDNTQTQPEQTQQPVQQAQQESQPTQTEQATPPAQPVAPSKPPIKTTQEERMWAAIGYIAFLGVVTLAMMPKSEFCKKHAQQGILIFLISFVSFILLALPIPLIYGIGSFIMIACSVLAIYGIVQSISSHEMDIPVFSGLAKLIPVNVIVGSLTGKKPVAPTNAQQAPSTAENLNQEQQPTQATPPPAPEQPQAQTNPEPPAAVPPTPEIPPAPETPQAPDANKPQEPQE